jgi:DNA-binding XRE family transcriptional regulator
MTTYVHQNYVRTQRRSSGLSQRELARILGYSDPWQVSRHERSRSLPTLQTAISYSIVFRVPVAAIFVELTRGAEKRIELNLIKLEEELRSRPLGKYQQRLVAHKLKWIEKRRAL